MHAKRAVAAFLAVVAVAMLWTATPAVAAGHQLISGSGSSWAANAVTQWIADVHKKGLQVVFSSTGSAQGRQDFANYIDDFAVSDIGYQGTDSTTSQADSSKRPYAYLPIVAGGTSLPYQIRQNGQLIRNLRLSGPTIAKIFSQKITNWDDPAITSDNNGRKLPNLRIIPVVHSEGSGSTYQFTRYLSKEFPSIWDSFSNAGATEYFPNNGSATRENGSDQMINFITSGAANGAIGYDEYSYALGKNYPVAKVLNAGGYYTLPNQYNVAVALTRAQINNDPSSKNYLLQDLDNVYTYNDTRVYPMSSYSYAIIPTSKTDTKMNSNKRQTIADYLDYSVCQGQAEMGKVGYSPLPINLVQSSFNQVKKLHSADPKVNVAQATPSACHNPTFEAGHPSANYLAKVAPKPEACDKQGAGPCVDNGNTGQLNPDQGGAKTSKGGTGGSTATRGSSNTAATGGGSPNAAPGAATANPVGTTGTAGAGAAATKIDPATGQLVDTGASGTGAAAQAASTTLASSQSKSTDIVLSVIAGLLLLLALVVPPIAAAALARRGAGR